MKNLGNLKYFYFDQTQQLLNPELTLFDTIQNEFPLMGNTEVRTLLSLKSTNFEIIKEDGKIKFVVKGYGHGVGMSQTGADSMAKSGSNYEEIIKHFYTGVEIQNVT